MNPDSTRTLTSIRLAFLPEDYRALIQSGTTFEPPPEAKPDTEAVEDSQ